MKLIQKGGFKSLGSKSIFINKIHNYKQPFMKTIFKYISKVDRLSKLGLGKNCKWLPGLLTLLLLGALIDKGAA